MKLTITNKDNEIELDISSFGYEIITDKHIYSIFEYHQNMILLLDDASIYQIDHTLKKNKIDNTIFGIFILKDNYINILKI